MGGIKKLLVLFGLLFLTAGAYASESCNIIRIPEFTYGKVKVKSQTIETKCDSAYCRFKIKGQTVRMAKSSVDVLNTSCASERRRAYNPYASNYFRRSYGGSNSHELGSSAGSRTRSSSGYGSSGYIESRHASCYRNKGRQYVRRDNCTSGDRLSTSCRGSKPAGTSTNYCYRYVKLILQDCGAVDSYLSGAYAKNAGPQLERAGFTKLNTTDPDRAPVGAVVVYDNRCQATHPAGHIEIKISESEYVSDYSSRTPASERSWCRPVKAIYYK